MTMTDRYGLPVSTSSAAAFEHYQEGLDRLLSYRPGADECFSAAVAADERLALAHAGAAILALFFGDMTGARAAVTRARECVSGTTRRERQHVEALSAIVAGEATRGLGLIEEQVADFPRDAALVHQASSLIGFSGRADREAHRLAFVERLAPAYGDDWWYQSALSFAYHEVGRLEEARRLSERSLEQYPGNANASHNIAHVCFETAENDGGVAFLTPWLAGYGAGPFRCHLAWHLALFELQQGHCERALDIYEGEIACAPNLRQAAMDGPALLWRLPLYGCEQRPLPWRSLVELSKRVSRPGFIFGEMHAALVYASSGDEAALATLIDGLRALDAKGHPIAGTVALPLVMGLTAFVADDPAAALAHFEPVEAHMHRIGGSHAQWEIFEETMVVCYLRLERYEDAIRLLRRRLGRRASPRDLVWLDQAQTAPRGTGG